MCAFEDESQMIRDWMQKATNLEGDGNFRESAEYCVKVIDSSNADNEDKRMAEKKLANMLHKIPPESSLFHVTPLFRLPHIFEKDAIICGKDVAKSGLNRRPSSSAKDDRKTPLGVSASDCILFFTNPAPNLISDKIIGCRKSKSGFPGLKGKPHVVLGFTPKYLLGANLQAYCCLKNFGRTEINNNKFWRASEPKQWSDAEEVWFRADDLPNREFSLKYLRSIMVFSMKDKDIVDDYIKFLSSELDQRVRMFKFPEIKLSTKVESNTGYEAYQNQQTEKDTRAFNHLSTTKEYLASWKSLSPNCQIEKGLSMNAFD